MTRPKKEPALSVGTDLHLPLTTDQKSVIVEATREVPEGIAAWAREILLHSAREMIAQKAVAGKQKKKSDSNSTSDHHTISETAVNNGFDASKRFAKLARKWKAETSVLSNVVKRAMNPSYQSIIGMGDSAVPLILNDLLKNGPDDWFWALTAITGQNPITKDIAGDMNAMTEAWLKWGRDAGYLKDYRQKPSPSSPTSSKGDTK